MQGLRFASALYVSLQVMKNSADVQISNHAYFQTALLGAALIAFGVVVHLQGLDLDIARAVWSLFGDSFARDQWFLKTVMHEGMRSVNIIAMSVVVIAAIYSRFKPVGIVSPRRLQAFALTALLFIGGVALLKSRTTFACPWGLEEFGGKRQFLDYADLFNLAQFGKGHCFPAGHSSGAYAWLGLGFGFARTQGALWRNLAVLVWPGLLLSTTQILRGAHFLSHEMTTFGLALISFSAMGLVLQKKSADK